MVTALTLKNTDRPQSKANILLNGKNYTHAHYITTIYYNIVLEALIHVTNKRKALEE